MTTEIYTSELEQLKNEISHLHLVVERQSAQLSRLENQASITPDAVTNPKTSRRRMLRRLAGVAAGAVAAATLSNNPKNAAAEFYGQQGAGFSSAIGLYAHPGNAAVTNGIAGGTVGLVGCSSNDYGSPGVINVGVYGYSNGATNIGVFGKSTIGTGIYGLSNSNVGVRGESVTGYGVIGQSGGSNAAIYGFSTGLNAVAVYGKSNLGNAIAGSSSAVGYASVSGSADGADGIGIYGIATALNGNGIGAYGKSNSPAGLGGYFEGGRAPLQLAARSTAGAPTTEQHSAGELYVDVNGQLFYCTTAGTPGTWVNLSGGSGGGTSGAVTVLTSPFRVAATIGAGARPKLIATGSNPAPSGTETAQIQIGGQGGIPGNAKGVLGTLTNVGATAGGNLRFWIGATAPNAVNLNVPGALPALNLSASFAIPLDAGGKTYLGWSSAVGSQCGYAVDITGYIL